MRQKVMLINTKTNRTRPVFRLVSGVLTEFRSGSAAVRGVFVVNSVIDEFPPRYYGNSLFLLAPRCFS